MEYPLDTAISLLASPFVDDALFSARLGGDKQDRDAVRRFMDLPIGARSDVAVYFDRAWYVRRYPDIAAADIDPMLHYIGWGHAEEREPHPLIDPKHMRAVDPQIPPGPLSIEALLDVLDNDRVDPSRLFTRIFYRAQLGDANAVTGGLLRHFLTEGLAAGLRPSPDLDPIAAYRQVRTRTLDIRDGLRQLALSGPSAQDFAAEPAAEGQAKALFVMNARALLPGIAHTPLEFGPGIGPPALSVIMVVHNQFALTLAALASLRSNFPEPIQLILVDSGSSDETGQIKRYVHGAEILRYDHNIGFLRGCNAGLQLAITEALLFMNNDIELYPGAVGAALARLRSDPKIGAVGAKLIRTHGLLQEAGCIVWRDGWTTGYMRDASPLAPEVNSVRDVDYCSAAFLLARTALVQELGGFDEAFAPAYYEDTDLCLRMQEAGYRVVYDPAVLVRHLEYGTSAGASAAAAEIAARHDVFVPA